METSEQKASKVLLDIDPLRGDSKLIINKDIRTLDDIRKSFKKEQNGNSVLDQVRNFLPKMASANDELAKEIKEHPELSRDIEDIGDEENAQYIEMNLALVDGLDYEDSTDTDSSCDDDDFDNTEITENNLKLPKHTKTAVDGDKPLISCIDSINDDDDGDDMKRDKMDCTESDLT
ncbi:hypothetical protein ACF0H5_014844 [Mactra antiquata]